MNGEAGKGDTPRPVEKKKYDESYTRIFGERSFEEFQKDSKTKVQPLK